MARRAPGKQNDEALEQLSEGEDMLRARAEVCLEMLSKPKEWFLSSGIVRMRLALDKILRGELALYGRGNATVERVKEYIYRFRGERISKFVEWFVGLFDVEWMIEDMDIAPEDALNFLLSLAMHAWNAYPHDELGGKSPLEIVASGEAPPGAEAPMPLFEKLLIQIIENGFLPENMPAMVKERVYNEDGSAEAFKRFRKWFLDVFPVGLNEKQLWFADYIVEKAWQYYPHRVLGDKSPLQRRIESVKHCEWSECLETKDLYVCEECGKVFCFPHGGLHLLENKGKKRPHVLRLVDDYRQCVRGILSRLKS